MASDSSRPGLLRALEETLRRFGAQSVLMTDLVATRVGLNSTDLECLDLLYLAGPTTAGRLAAHTGLTTGATTAVIDRLERAGFVRRRPHPDDRRCVVVEVVPSSVSRIAPLYVPLAAAMAGLHERFDDRQLAIVLEYMAGAYELCASHAAWLQQQPRMRSGRTARTGRRRARARGLRRRERRPRETPRA